MIEMVAVTPLLLLLLLGISELGKALVQYNTLNKSVREAAREVARYALLGTTGTVSLTDDLKAEGRNLVVYGNVAGTGEPRLPALSASHVSVDHAGDNQVLIRVNYPYTPIFGPVLESFGFGDGPSTSGITLTASVVMRAL
jgi:Flp pilus assembly protein TadG